MQQDLQEEPPQINGRHVPDAGKDRHDQSEEADHDMRDEDELLRRSFRLNVRFVDIECQETRYRNELG
jgi:hypothetical protein